MIHRLIRIALCVSAGFAFAAFDHSQETIWKSLSLCIGLILFLAATVVAPEPEGRG